MRLRALLATSIALTLLSAGFFAVPASAANPGDIVINEIMQNPGAVADSSGEWFELYNPTAVDIDINGWIIQDNDFDYHVIDNGGPLVISAGGYLVLGNNADPATNGGVTVDYVYGSDWYLANAADEIVLLDDLGNEIDRVEYDDGITFPDPIGASISLYSPSVDNNAGENWCTASTPFGSGDLGTPGAANDCPQASDCVFINGGFETGDFTGWNVVTGPGEEYWPWTVISSRAPGFLAASFPAEGAFFATNGFDGDAGLYYDIYQEVVIPADVTSVQLSWSERIQWDFINFFGSPMSLPRLYEVTIQPAGGGAPIATLFTVMLEPDTVGDTGWVDHNIDLLTTAPGIVGSTVRINWHELIPEEFTGPALFDFDDVCLTLSSDSPEPPPEPPVVEVGGEIYPSNSAYLLIPWIIIAVAILAISGTILVLKRRRIRS